MKTSPIKLLTSDRLDVIPRLRMARALVAGRASSNFDDYFSKQYLSYFGHLAANSKIVDESGSFTLRERLRSFSELVASIKVQGFREDISCVSVEPVGQRFLLNGAHRLAACIALGQEIETDVKGQLSPPLRDFSLDITDTSETGSHGSVNAAYHRQIGFSDEFVRGLVLEYSRLAKTTRFIVLFDERESLCAEVEGKLASQAKILDRVDINLSQDGLFRFIHSAYQLQDWWAPSYVQDIARSKTGSNKERYTASVFTYEPRYDTTAHSIKLTVREHIEAMGNNGRLIHGSDEWRDTQHILDLVLSKPGRHFLNHAPYMAEAALLERLNNYEDVSGIDEPKGNRVIVGSSILEIYGLRRARDIDYISWPNLPNEFDWGNRTGDYLRENSLSLEEALYDSAHQFGLFGRKFQSLAAYCLIQEERVLTKKGREDFQLARSLLKEDVNSELVNISVKLSLSLRKMRWWLIVTAWRWYGKIGGWLPEIIKKPLRPILAFIQKRELFDKH